MTQENVLDALHRLYACSSNEIYDLNYENNNADDDNDIVYKALKGTPVIPAAEIESALEALKHMHGEFYSPFADKIRSVLQKMRGV